MEGLRAFVGFDGYVDRAVRAVRSRTSAREWESFGSMAEFGRRVAASAGKNADIELMPLGVYPGGNGPILAGALARLGVETTLVGTLDIRGGYDPFRELHPLCRQVSVGEASLTTALEFDDGKVMLGELLGGGLTWGDIKIRAGTEFLSREIGSAGLAALVNWSGLIHMNSILRGLLEEVLLPLEKGGHRPHILFDLADPSARSKEDLLELSELLRRYAALFPVTLGLNANEAQHLGAALSLTGELPELCGAIRSTLGLWQVCLHTPRGSWGAREGALAHCPVRRNDAPRRATGAGDHFNAGLALGILEGRTLQECLLMGNTAAGLYLETGADPDRDALEKAMTERK